MAFRYPVVLLKLEHKITNQIELWLTIKLRNTNYMPSGFVYFRIRKQWQNSLIE